MRITVENFNYEEKLKEISSKLNGVTKYKETHEFKNAMENISKLSSLLKDIVVAVNQSEAMQSFSRFANQIKSFQLPAPSQDVIKGMKCFHNLNKLERLQWPLYFMYTDELMEALNPYTYLSEDNEQKIREIVFDFCTVEFVEKLYEDWIKSSVINEKRIPILREAIEMYMNNAYYACVALLACQLNGIITDTYEMQVSYGKEFDFEEVMHAYESFNPTKEKPNRIDKKREKNQLLWFITDAEDGIVYWIKAIEYIYNIILTSDNTMDESNHPCRNKICHGIQMNYGTKEHSLKSILTIDMMIRLAENLKSVNEESVKL